MGTQRFSFKSPDRTRQGGTLTRESSLRGGAPPTRSRPLETPSLELGDEDTQSLRSDADSSVAEAQQPGSGGHTGATADTEELKADEDQNGGGGGDKSVKDDEAEADPASKDHQEDKGGEGDTTARSESSSELNHSFDSESLDLQLSAVANGTLYIEEKEDSPPANGLAVDSLGSKEVSQKVSSLGQDRAELDTY